MKKGLSKDHFSKANLVAFVLVFACIGGYILLSSHAASSVANVFVSPNGSDTGANCKRFASTVSNPDPGGTSLCATFNKVLQLAQRGDTVEVENGTYGPQHITAVPAGSSGLVTFTPAQGASVTIGNGGSNTCGGSSTTGYQLCIEDGSYFELDNMSLAAGAKIKIINTDPSRVGSHNITLKNLTATTIRLYGRLDTINVLGGNYGNNDESSKPQIGFYNPTDAATAAPTNVVIDGATFHDTVCTDGQHCATTDHAECLQVLRSVNLTIKNNTFYNCDGTGDVGITDGPHANLTLENNFIAKGTMPSTFGCQITKNGSYTIRNNSSDTSCFFSDTDTGGPYVITGNYMPYHSSLCGAGITTDYNVFKGSSTCGAHDTAVAALDFVDAVNHNFHLIASANAIDKGNPTNCPATDIDGNPRPQGTTCDAGADEYATPAGSLANLWIDTTGGTCTRSATPVAYNDAAACSSFDAANDVCQNNDLALVKAGSYGDQVLSGSNARTAACTIETVTGESVNLHKLEVPAGANWLTFKDMTDPSGVSEHNTNIGNCVTGVCSHADNVVLDNIDVTGPYAFVELKGNNVTWKNSELGTAGNTSATPRLCNNDPEPAQISEGSNMLIDHVIFHPFFGEEVQAHCGGNDVYHLETIRAWDSINGFKLSNSWFDDGRGDDSATFSSSKVGNPPNNTNMHIVGNYFGNHCCGYAAPDIIFGDQQPCAGWVIAYNLFKNGDAGLTDYCSSESGMVYVGNEAYNGGGCPFTGVNTGNLFTSAGGHGTCAGNTWVTAPAADDYSAFNLASDGMHLTASSPAINAGEDSYCMTWTGNLDYDSQSRTGVCDAGPDEYTAGAGPTDTTPPAVPQGLHVTGTTRTSISIAWNASTDNIGISGYHLYKANSIVGTTTSLSYTFSGLTCATNYTNLGLTAFDAANNESNVAQAIVVPTSTAACAKPGDVNGDSKVNLQDLSILLTHYGQSATANQGDLNGDSLVTLIDLSILLSNYGT